MGVINQLLTLFLWTFSFLGLFLADAALPLCDIPIDQLSRAQIWQMPHPTTNQHLVVLFCYVSDLENKLNIWCSNQLYLTCLFLFRICMNPPCLTLQAPCFAITTINQWQFLDDIAMLKSSVTSPSGGCVEPWAPGRGVGYLAALRIRKFMGNSLPRKAGWIKAVILPCCTCELWRWRFKSFNWDCRLVI